MKRTQVRVRPRPRRREARAEEAPAPAGSSRDLTPVDRLLDRIDDLLAERRSG